MKLGFCITFLAILFCRSVSAQQASFQDTLLDRLEGKWVLNGKIAGQRTTHDVVAKWVLAHNYLQIHEVSRETDEKGGPVYEAIVYVGWDNINKEYRYLWLDVTGGGGLSSKAIGRGKRDGDLIAFLFTGADDSLFHTTFVYDKTADTWQWLMDGEENGKLQPFARLKLTRE